jgi:DNA-binding MarR family transcriptional regulator
MIKVKMRDRVTVPAALVVADRLHSAAIHLLRRVRKQDAVSGVGPTQLSALSVLVFGGAKTLGELARSEQVKPPTMSRVVAALQRNDLIEITRAPKDARRMQISATEKGTKLLQQGRQRRIEDLASHLENLNPDELTQLANGVGILEKLLRDWAKTGKFIQHG